jgi:hypothetical protein
MPPHVHHRRRFPRGFRPRGGVPVVIEQITDTFEPDVYFVTTAELDEAGSILPTFVTADDAKRYIDETDTGYDRLNVAILASSAPADFKTSWALQLGGWKTFSVAARASVGFLNASAVMDQTDRYGKQLEEWRASFEKIGGNAPGPAPVAPGQGVPSSSNTLGAATGLIVAAGVVAAIVIFGPRLAKE